MCYVQNASHCELMGDPVRCTTRIPESSGDAGMAALRQGMRAGYGLARCYAVRAYRARYRRVSMTVPGEARATSIPRRRKLPYLALHPFLNLYRNVCTG